jgi:UDP-N-acetyl-D-galactosamine dehydrogenase
MALERVVSVTGLGYVGLPVAVAFGRHGRVIAHDASSRRIAELRQGRDRNGETPPEDLRGGDVLFTDKPEDLRQATFHIVAVPTPVDAAKRPDLTLMRQACESVGRALKKGDVVVFESTVYPGVTEDECAPILARVSGLQCGTDFTLGYSPERINPGDREHTLANVRKVVAGQDGPTLDLVARMYETIVKAGVHRAASIRVAEAAKVIENTQRDLNIALMNELAFLFDRVGLDTLDVLEAAGTKWNFLRFRPGLVGGHCIGVDPYYLTHLAETLDYLPQVILAGRRINDSVGRFVAQRAIKEIIRAGNPVRGGWVTVLGLTFKENCADLRNSKVADILAELGEYGMESQVYDPHADPEEAFREYGVTLKAWNDLAPASAVIAAVGHDAFKTLTMDDLKRLMLPAPVLIDVKGLFPRDQLAAAGIRFWRL